MVSLVERFMNIDKCHSHWWIDDLQLSRSHVRFHTVKIPSSQTRPQSARPHQLVFVEDLSRNGVYLNHRLLRKKSAMSLMCHGDVLRLTAQTFLTFEETDQDSRSWFNLRQEHELKVGLFTDSLDCTDRSRQCRKITTFLISLSVKQTAEEH